LALPAHERQDPLVSTHLDLYDHESDSAAFVTLTIAGGLIQIGLGVERNGDLDLILSVDDARRVAETIVAVADEARRA
jgi:hypothetical protein